MTVIYVILAIFSGFSMIVLVMGLVVLVAAGRVTIPGTHEHRVRAAEAEHLIAAAQTRALGEKMNLEQLHETRLRRALERGDEL